jgi:hypothetical protein
MTKQFCKVGGEPERKSRDKMADSKRDQDSDMRISGTA